jgi:hypothetical protein
VPDANKQAELQALLAQEETKLATLQASIINKEAESSSWLTRNIRPLAFAIFLLMTVAYFIMYTIIPYVIVITDSNLYAPMDPGLNEGLLSIIEICLGGYIGGRSVEKVARIIKK